MNDDIDRQSSDLGWCALLSIVFVTVALLIGLCFPAEAAVSVVETATRHVYRGIYIHERDKASDEICKARAAELTRTSTTAGAQGRYSCRIAYNYVGTWSADPVPPPAPAPAPTPPPVTPPPADSGPGQAVLSWIAPTRNTDGSALTNLSGFRIHYFRIGAPRTQWPVLIRTVPASSIGITLTDLQPGTWHFWVEALATDGSRSELSNALTKVVR